MSASAKISTAPNAWPKVAASAAIFRNGEILIGLRGKDPRNKVWSLPGGHIEPGETARDAALREVREETGIEAHILGLLDINDVILHRPDGSLRAHYLLTIFYGTWLGGEPCAADDCLEARFIAPGDVKAYETTDRLAEFVRQAHDRWNAHQEPTGR